MRDLMKQRPAAIVVQRNDIFESVTGNGLDSRGELPNFPALQALVEAHYEPVASIEDFDIYLRTSARSAPAAQ